MTREDTESKISPPSVQKTFRLKRMLWNPWLGKQTCEMMPSALWKARSWSSPAHPEKDPQHCSLAFQVLTPLFLHFPETMACPGEDVLLRFEKSALGAWPCQTQALFSVDVETLSKHTPATLWWALPPPTTWRLLFFFFLKFNFYFILEYSWFIRLF